MEKLIELLNEYKKIKGYDGNTKITNYDTDTGSFTNGYSGLEYEIVIGKRYGFIKWLVENDKIDLENLQCVFSGNINKWKTLMLETDGYERYEGTEYEATESLLMLLSISDTPIEDLLLYLK